MKVRLLNIRLNNSIKGHALLLGKEYDADPCDIDGVPGYHILNEYGYNATYFKERFEVVKGPRLATCLDNHPMDGSFIDTTRELTIGKNYEILHESATDFLVVSDLNMPRSYNKNRFILVEDTNQFQKPKQIKQMKVNFPTRTRHVAALSAPAPLKLKNGSLYKVTVDGNSVVARLHEKVRAKLDGTQYYVFSVHKKPFLATEDEISLATKADVQDYLKYAKAN